MCADSLVVAGWDVGGVNVKAARVTVRDAAVVEARAIVRPFEIWHQPEELARVLRGAAGEAEIAPSVPMAVTMTAELSDAFASRREGVLHVLEAVREAFPRAPLHVLSAAGAFTPEERARRTPLDYAATNWIASALFVAERVPDCVLVDVGSTTTDIIPIRGGRVVAEGRSDSARLVAGELVYSGVLRTNPNTVSAVVPLRGRQCRVAAEWFSQMADVHLMLGHLTTADYTCRTPDGRGTSAAEVRARLARLVCEDAETQTEEETRAIAAYLHERQVGQVVDGLLQVLSRQPAPPPALLAAGVGAFLAAEAGRRSGLAVLDPRPAWRGMAAAALPAGAAAALLARSLLESRS